MIMRGVSKELSVKTNDLNRANNKHCRKKRMSVFYFGVKVWHFENSTL